MSTTEQVLNLQINRKFYFKNFTNQISHKPQESKQTRGKFLDEPTK